MAWSRSQQILLAILPKISSVLSLLGSLWISIEFVFGKHSGEEKNRFNPYHRLLFAMSVFDILESVWNFTSTWPIPEGTKNLWDPRGNQATCSAQGFFLMLGVAIPIYNAHLALYYLLIINYRITEMTIKGIIEPLMHISACGWAIGTAVAALFLNQYNNANLWCWIAPYPPGCKDSWSFGKEANCERGDNAWIYRWAFYFAPLWSCIAFSGEFGRPCYMLLFRCFSDEFLLHLISLGVCTFLVCAHVSELDRRTVRFRRPESFRGIYDNSDISAAGSHDSADDPESDKPNGWWASFVNRHKMHVENNPRTVQVQVQALFFMMTFFLTHFWSTTNRIIQQIDGKSIFWLTVVHSFFDPLQGFLNFLVFQRPRYAKMRRLRSDLGRFEAVKFALQPSWWPERGLFPNSRSRHSSADSNNTPQRPLNSFRQSTMQRIVPPNSKMESILEDPAEDPEDKRNGEE